MFRRHGDLVTDVDQLHFADGGGNGTFASPMGTLTAALPLAQQNGRIKIKRRSTTWPGSVNGAVRLDAPLGTVRIGGP